MTEHCTGCGHSSPGHYPNCRLGPDSLQIRAEKKANDRQVGGSHYKIKGRPEHWDLAVWYNWDPFQYQITKYVMRWKDKNGLQDLEKALHFLQKYIEVAENYAKPKVPDFLQFVKPDGWIGFTFEGVDANGFLYTCRRCRTTVTVGEFISPWSAHDSEDCLRKKPAESPQIVDPPKEQIEVQVGFSAAKIIDSPLFPEDQPLPPVG